MFEADVSCELPEGFFLRPRVMLIVGLSAIGVQMVAMDKDWYGSFGATCTGVRQYVFSTFDATSFIPRKTLMFDMMRIIDPSMS